MDKFDALTEQLGLTARSIVTALTELAPTLLTAATLLLIGWLVARLGRHLVRRLVAGLDWVLGRATARSEEAASRLQSATARAVSEITFWVILLVFIAAAARTLGSPIVDEWTANLLGYLPTFISGVLIIVVGIVGGVLSRYVIEPAASGMGIARSALIGRLTQASVVTIGLLVGFAQIGIDVTFLVNIVTVIIAATLVAVALSLSLGTREHVANIVGARYVRKYFRIGDTVRVGDIEGRIVDVADGYLFLDTDNGELSLPAHYYTREPFLKINEEQEE